MIYTTSFGAAIMAWILCRIITNKYGKMFLMAIGFMLYGLVINALLNTWIGYGYVFLGFFYRNRYYGLVLRKSCKTLSLDT